MVMMRTQAQNLQALGAAASPWPLTPQLGGNDDAAYARGPMHFRSERQDWRAQALADATYYAAALDAVPGLLVDTSTLTDVVEWLDEAEGQLEPRAVFQLAELEQRSRMLDQLASVLLPGQIRYSTEDLQRAVGDRQQQDQP